MKKKRNDIILIAALLLLAVAGALLYMSMRTDGDVAIVLSDGKEIARYPLDTDIETVITTEYGANKLVISGGKAYISEADCPDKICVEHREIFYNGDTIVCLPHKLVIKIEKGVNTESSQKIPDVAV